MFACNNHIIKALLTGWVWTYNSKAMNQVTILFIKNHRRTLIVHGVSI